MAPSSILSSTLALQPEDAQFVIYKKKKRISANQPISAVKEMDAAKHLLLQRYFPDTPPSSIHSGYHRGRRRLFGPIIWPDIISVHHLHLHVIVEPRVMLRLFKYPAWMRWMWLSDERVMDEVARRKGPRMKG